MAGSTPSHSVAHYEWRDESWMALVGLPRCVEVDNLQLFDLEIKSSYCIGRTHGKLVLGLGQDSVQLGEGV